MRKLLIIGASILQLPAIKKAKEMGFYLGVVDYNPNAVGVPLADEFFCVSTIDIEGVVQVAEEFQPDGIMTLATDMPMRSVAFACNKLGYTVERELGPGEIVELSVGKEIVQLARQIDTFDTSILPYEDCCTVFTPRHPRTRPELAKVEAEERKLPFEALCDAAYATKQTFYVKAEF